MLSVMARRIIGATWLGGVKEIVAAAYSLIVAMKYE